MNAKPGPYDLASTYLRLRNNGTIELLPVDENFWSDLVGGKHGKFKNEYLVTTLAFHEDWPSWEQHPNGDELVYLLSGSADFVLEIDGEYGTVELRDPGSFVKVPQGAWHTAKIREPTAMLFVTAGEDTLNRPV